MVTGKTDDQGSPEAQRRAQDEDSPDEHHGPMGKLKDKFHHLKVDAINLKHHIGKYGNLFNRNHRHDEEHEQATDAKRTRIAESHRFQSYAPERDGNRIKWYIDGRDYFHALSVSLERAKETIYIADWWLSPELFLRRPPHFHQKWRLDYTLKRAAERGVNIFVIVYKEVEQAVTCNSKHTKHALEALCPEGTPGYRNIVVMRHPDHNVFENASDMTFYWAHHEKFVVIDYELAYIGGLDLCFGRWDNRQHPLADVHPAGVENEVWPGQDFNNNRIMDFQNVEDWKSNELSKAEFGRMPWHDIAMGLVGPCVYDIAEHFVLRWNFCKRDKYKRDDRYDWITMTGRTGEDEDLIGVQRPKHPVGDYIHHPLSPLEHKAGNPQQRTAAQQPDGSAGEGEVFHDAPETLDEHGYTSQQHRVGHGVQKRFHDWQRSHSHEHAPHAGFGASTAGPNTDPRDAAEQHPGGSQQENDKMTGNNPKKEGTITASGGRAEKLAGYASNVAGADTPIVGQGSIHAQLVRSSADWSSGILTEQSIQNAYCQVIREAQHYVYFENQFFITATGENQSPIHNLIGAAIVDACVRADREGRKFKVIILIPCIPGFAGDLRDDAATGTRAIMDYQYKSINRGEHSIYGRLKAAGVEPTKYISCFNLRSFDRLNKTPALTKQEQQSGVTYAQVQRAQAEEIMPTGVHGAAGEGSPKHPAAPDRPELARNQQSAKQVFEGERSGVGLAGEGTDKVTDSVDSIAKDALLDEPKVSEEDYAGRGRSAAGKDEKENEEAREQEKENFVCEELYIHAKLLIVDDRVVICGSSNINDRSQLGFHDSELSIVMEDTKPLPSTMDGQPFNAGYHAATLRRMLWREHLGLLPAQTLDASDDVNAQPPEDGESHWFAGDKYDKLVEDPLSDELWEMWTDRATTNTGVFRHLFHVDPDDNIKTFEQYDQFLGAKGSRKAGHLFDPYQPVDHVREQLDKIRGHLVWMPLDFLCEAEMAEKGLAVNAVTESVYT